MPLLWFLFLRFQSHNGGWLNNLHLLRREGGVSRLSFSPVARFVDEKSTKKFSELLRRFKFSSLGCIYTKLLMMLQVIQARDQKVH